MLPSSTVENNLRFPGQYWDEETGLHYNFHRYYDSGIGRYLRADPIGVDGGLNFYTYVNSNPNIYIDPKGLHKTDKGCKWSGSLSLLGGGNGFVGAATIVMELTSECCMGMKAKGVYFVPVASGLMLGPLPGQALVQPIELYGNSSWRPPSDKDPTGSFSYYSVSTGLFISGSSISTGSLVGSGFSFYVGIDFGVDAIIGVTTGGGSTECCDEEWYMKSK